jgi:hypothetical protein
MCRTCLTSWLWDALEKTEAAWSAQAPDERCLACPECRGKMPLAEVTRLLKRTTKSASAIRRLRRRWQAPRRPVAVAPAAAAAAAWDPATAAWMHAHTRQCPGCTARFERASGCSALRCASCSTVFCYDCLSIDICTCPESTGDEIADLLEEEEEEEGEEEADSTDDDDDPCYNTSQRLPDRTTTNASEPASKGTRAYYAETLRQWCVRTPRGTLFGELLQHVAQRLHV